MQVLGDFVNWIGDVFQVANDSLEWLASWIDQAVYLAGLIAIVYVAYISFAKFKKKK